MAGLFSLLLHVTSFYFQCKSLFHGVPLPPSSLEYGACVVLGALCLFFCSFAALLYTCRSRRKAARRVSAGRRSPKPTSARSRAKTLPAPVEKFSSMIQSLEDINERIMEQLKEQMVISERNNNLTKSMLTIVYPEIERLNDVMTKLENEKMIEADMLPYRLETNVQTSDFEEICKTAEYCLLGLSDENSELRHQLQEQKRRNYELEETNGRKEKCILALKKICKELCFRLVNKSS
ncbi:uncharacterized protein LOC120542925 isoform X1 [Polypterus senegalus]|uniref:uncharacterized protein LOC120542925 isoform X1 n=1 Tax=Polypterus senegalus TaxID=55291 RepID=UPI001965F5D7|nr:uncharacterized protein LOC120542925 isoform X1 [Polypterus senegalus]